MRIRKEYLFSMHRPVEMYSHYSESTTFIASSRILIEVTRMQEVRKIPLPKFMLRIS